MELLNSFLGQGMIAQIGEIVLFANTVTMAMPTRWRGKNMPIQIMSKRFRVSLLNRDSFFFFGSVAICSCS